MNKSEIIKATEEVYAKAVSMFGVRFPMPTIEFYRGNLTAGTANSYLNQLRFNMDFAEKNSAKFHETVIHEMAHLVTKYVYPSARQAHGPEFKMIDKKLGGRGTARNSYDLPDSYIENKFPYAYSCDCRTHHFGTRKHNSVVKNKTRYTCRACKGELVFVSSSKETV